MGAEQDDNATHREFPGLATGRLNRGPKRGGPGAIRAGWAVAGFLAGRANPALRYAAESSQLKPLCAIFDCFWV